MREMVSGRIALIVAGMLVAACGSDERSDGEPAGDLGGVATNGAAPNAGRFPLPYPHLTPPVYAVGEPVEVFGGGKWHAGKVVEVAQVNGEQVVRTSWPGGGSDLPYLVSDRATELRRPTGRLGVDLTIGRYICYDGGTDRSDLNFRVGDWGRYTDPYGERPGTFAVADDRIVFTGGVLDGQVGQQVTRTQFQFTPQFTCRYQMEGL
ncbi:hypothetical protein M9979_05035 [Sphingomonas sp. RP10(2022)]|uniref:Uncharacterized protein n=1 Tax=Sphingomonas liriopis TaxID=2949094 RepID=A0A9X2HWT0_9SPHN|nr:hypothetical protein [Sphingomonas liriopis]MCP3734240.1 hypothetical protein [Sphingomonas liriopis]